MKKTQRTTVKGLFQRENGEIMIVKSALDEYWELPGGKMEFGEQPEETLRREVKEEFNIDEFEIKRLLDLFTFEATDEDTHWCFNVAVYLCSLSNENFNIFDEHEDVKWVQPKDIHSTLMRDGYYKTIGKLI